jgi:glutaconate CoA-transferase subunit B
MPDASTDYTVDELIVSLISRDIRDHELVQQGGGTQLGSVAVMLARRTHAPNLTYNYLTSMDPIVTSVGNPADSPHVVSQTALAPFDIGDIVWMCLRGKTDVFSTMPAQVDRYGNVNASLIGDDQQRPKVRFPGGLGISDWTLYAGRVNVYVPRHTRRVFVEKVDYVTGLGHFPGGFAERVRRGVPGRGPRKVFSNLAVMGFDPETGRMRLDSLHAGVRLEDVQANTSFDLLLPDQIPETPPPTVEEVDLIRNVIDPKGLRKHRF